MNPLLLKIGLPAMIFAAIAFMKWSNAKATGTPIFPSVSNDATRQGKSVSGSALPDPTSGVITEVGRTDSVGATTSGDSPAGSEIGTDYSSLTTDYPGAPQHFIAPSNDYPGSAQHFVPGGGGGYQSVSPLAQGLKPSSPAPGLNIPAFQSNGSYGVTGGKTFAI
jgi:hypothetical protein